MKRNWTFLWILFFLLMGMVGLSFTAAGSDDVILLSNEQIRDANVNGIELSQTGTYSVWAWSKNSIPLYVHIEGNVLKVLPNTDSNDEYSWKKLGESKLEKDGRISIRVLTDEESQILQPHVVGWLALSIKPNWTPGQYFDLTKVYEGKAEIIDDQRLGILRSNREYYHFPGYESKREWLERKYELNDHILVSMGTYPLPEKTPLNPKIFGRIEHEDYTVEKVYFESYPGFFVTGNLYRPKGKSGPFPGVVSPHGHWSEGRLANNDRGSVPGRAINFAKQGYVVFTYDMVGYVDSKQIGHKFGDRDEWLWGISLHGLQFWNSIRAVDFLSSLPDVDPEKIWCTGASGGGTQTFCLMAVDDRVKVAAPVNMISAHFQGGCLCENAPNLRANATNVEFGAMMAPRPLLMVSATGDWTNETMRVEYPSIRSIYELFDAKDHVQAVQIDAPHNYNKQSREAVYAWFGRWLLGIEDSNQLREEEFTVESDEDLRVFPGPLPDHAINEEQLVSYLIEQSEYQFQEVFPENELKLRALRRRARTALKHAFGAEQPERDELDVKRVEVIKQDGLTLEKYILSRKCKAGKIPGILLIPDNWDSIKEGVLLLHGEGKQALFDLDTAKPCNLLQLLLDEGYIVFMPDVFMTGEFNTSFEKAQREKDISHFLTYNQTKTALRIQDILTSKAFLESRYESNQNSLIGVGEAGMWSLLAAPFMDSLDTAIIDANGFDSDDDEVYLNKLLVPGLRRAGDVRAAQALLAPTPLMIYNTQRVFETKWAEQAYKTAGMTDLLEVMEGPASMERISVWLKDMRL